MKTVLKIVGIAIFVLSLTLAACSQGKPEDKSSAPAAPAATELTVAHVVNEKDPFNLGAVKFKELVEARTNGQVKIKIVPGGALGNERDLIEGMKIGSVDGGVITTGPISGFVPEMMVFDLPFIFRDKEHAYKVLDGPIGDGILKKLEGINITGLAFMERGFRQLTNSKKAIQSPADMKGLKFRLMENPVYLSAFKALGANATPMAWGEVYTALQQGTIDGQENPINVIATQKIFEVQKYLSLTGHAYAPAVLMFNKKKLESLSSGNQDILRKAAREAAAYERKLIADSEGDELKFLKEKGMIINEKPDKEAFRKATEGVYKEFEGKIGKELIESVINTK